jgi:hypothetical protein
MITYKYIFCAAIKVYLDGKFVGSIHGTGIPGGYYYKTKSGYIGEQFESIAAVKESLS